MKFHAAIVTESKSPLTVCEIEFTGTLGVGQVMVDIELSGICGAQINEIEAAKGPDKFLPHLLGHEGLGKVQSIGPGVTTVSVGDEVILHWRPSLGIQSQTPHYDWNGKLVNAGWVTTFNHNAVVSENRLTRVDTSGIDREILPLMGCALTTALGVLENDAKANFRDTLLVFGAGGVGLCILKLAHLFGIRNAVVVDISNQKLKLAEEISKAHVVRFNDKEDCKKELKKIFREIKPTVAVDTTGKSECIELAYEVTHDQGRVVLVGVPNINDSSRLYTLPIHFGKRILGSHGGGSHPHLDIPLLRKLFLSKELDFSDYPRSTYRLTQINQALDAFKSDQPGRILLEMN